MIHVTHLKVMPCPTDADNAEDWTSSLRQEFVHAIEEWRKMSGMNHQMRL